MRALTWLMRAAVFFVLFAFALNNQDDATIKWFFGREWHAPMVFIVLAAFALGCALGIAAMLPSWWRHRRLAQQQRTPRLDTSPATLDATTTMRGTEPAPLEHPPRDGV
jgi:uncharacterized integral membrane protein